MSAARTSHDENRRSGDLVAPMRYLSVCSGIEAATVAWHPLGWQPVGFAEIEKFPAAVLATHYPDVPNFGDMTKFKEWPDVRPDVLVGGTPCQSFSVAGLRKGMADPRGNLALTYLAIADRYRPEWLLWENVPGVLSSNGGRDFGAFLGGMVELGYGFAYRVLDAQYVRVDGFGRAVPQRRRRVFVVGNSRDWRRAAAVLFERESLSGNPAPRRKTGEGSSTGIARSVALRGREGGGTAELGDEVGDTLRASTGGGDKPHALIGFDGQNLACGDEVFATLDTGAAHLNRGLHVAHSLRGEGFDASEDGTGRGTPLVPVAFAENSRGELRLQGGDGQISPQLTTGGGKPGQGQPCIAHAIQAGALRENPDSGPDGIGVQADAAYTLEARAEVQAVQQGWAVRRLTPQECERLQGFPDGYTQVPWRGKNGAPDGPRYKALGNSMAANAMRWLGTRIQMVNEMTAQPALSVSSNDRWSARR